jgi:hypothetical protein
LNEKHDPNLALFVNKDEVEKKLREVKIQTAFRYNRELLINEKKNDLPKRV